jgi:hypothetical protein
MGAIISNTNVNYSLYYNLVNALAEYCAQHPSIAGVGNEELSDFDERAFPSYPIANIVIKEAVFKETTTDWEVYILIADKYKNKDNESNPTNNEQKVPFYGTDDMMDIWANTMSIMNDITAFIQRGLTGFEINENISCTNFHERFDSGLAGWEVTFTLTTHNDKNRCLFDLYPN